jgi:hypothetical protein
MFSRWIATNITYGRGTLHCRKTRIPCGDHCTILVHTDDNVSTVYGSMISFGSEIRGTQCSDIVF